MTSQSTAALSLPSSTIPNFPGTSEGVASVASTDCSGTDLSSSPVLSCAALVMGLVIMAENGLLIATIYRTRSLHTNTNILVASLAVTDLLMGLQASSIGVYTLTDGFKGWFGSDEDNQRLFDSFMAGQYITLVAVSISHMAILALDRYLFVKWPFRYARRCTRKKVLTTAAILWTCGILYMLLPLVILQDPKYHETCIIFDTPFFYGGGPLLLVYMTSFTVVLGSTVGLAKLAFDHKRRHGKRRVIRLGEPSLRVRVCQGQQSSETRTLGQDKDRSSTESGTIEDQLSFSNNHKPNEMVLVENSDLFEHNRPVDTGVAEGTGPLSTPTFPEYHSLNEPKVGSGSRSLTDNELNGRERSLPDLLEGKPSQRDDMNHRDVNKTKTSLNKMRPHCWEIAI